LYTCNCALKVKDFDWRYVRFIDWCPNIAFPRPRKNSVEWQGLVIWTFESLCGSYTEGKARAEQEIHDRKTIIEGQCYKIMAEVKEEAEGREVRKVWGSKQVENDDVVVQG
jgi:hypothetical protein